LLLHLADFEHENKDNEHGQIMTHHDTSPLGTVKMMLKFDCKPLQAFPPQGTFSCLHPA
jgi:hypothetical protein